MFFMALLLISGCSTKEPEYKKIDTAKPVVVDSQPIIKTETTQPKVTYDVGTVQVGYKERGVASWYGKELQGEKTASGEIFNMYALTAAHRTLPMGTIVKVTNLENGKSVVVRINDRGPYDKRRIIDLSYKAAFNLGITSVATAKVELEVLGFSNKNNRSSIEKQTTSKTIKSTPVIVSEPEVKEIKKIYTPPKKRYKPKKVYKTKKSYKPKRKKRKIEEEIINEPTFEDEQVLDKKTKMQLEKLHKLEMIKSKKVKKSSGEYYIQMGSFRNYNGAKKFRKELQDEHPDHKVLIKEAEINGKTYHRVVISGFKSRREAKEYKDDYGLKGFIKR